ncbi:MAG: bifunctional diaminohydroxyphosphoribosylaminopyrimidine deaminase/5-amino-6-(5-phosphoribosylamino)uracil reductase RibD [Parasphingorhabdus sp.]|nr:bifunctional diaminohydroxyphosphoribosylaminopyrimidine deaminase/5-amino-6-(5-phosphoribosylamino)uracil reductase RibD [Parasphingorhabdus sp.]
MPPADARFLAAALALGERARGLSGTNPNVGCVIVRDGRVIGRGWTQPGGRPHAEAMALAEAGAAARGSDVYVTLEPCAHKSDRGPACLDLLIAAAPARVFSGCIDIDKRTFGKGIANLLAAGIDVASDQDMTIAATRSMAGYFTRLQKERPHVTLKLALSLDGCIALADGRSRWITGARARAHAHLERARCDAILVGAGTMRADNPQLDVRLEGLTQRAPQRIVLGSGDVPDGWQRISAPPDIAMLGVNWLLVEGGAQTAAAFLRADLVDRLLLYRAPIIIGGGLAGIGDIGLGTLDDAHGRWRLHDRRTLGADVVEIYDRAG